MVIEIKSRFTGEEIQNQIEIDYEGATPKLTLNNLSENFWRRYETSNYADDVIILPSDGGSYFAVVLDFDDGSNGHNFLWLEMR